ncbi:hypothetical protein [Collinsella vaginalis]|uniref:hypothetical protein n=1 Tax=Collinsella vaginalis TaxID=1870987 RepID=UPI000A270C85|nr:hypothetical protein [Collinsella vaginalis]
MGKAHVKICPKCSGIKAKALVEAGVAKSEIATGCNGGCLKKHPELRDRVAARVDGKLVSAKSEKKLAKKVAEALSA